MELKRAIEILGASGAAEAASFAFSNITYDSRDVNESTLFFAKGAAFKRDYLVQAYEEGLRYYVSEVDYEIDGLTLIKVGNIRRAMGLIAQEFYGFPHKKLKVIGFTGTKGKTTASYFTTEILKSVGKVAMLSTMNSTLDGVNYFKSKLTTPEALELYKYMAEAVKNGMEYFVMEVSSQAYKMERVYGLHFDVGVWLNITPDHIGTNEHPDFEDYLNSKLNLMENSSLVIINKQTDFFETVYATAIESADRIITYGASDAEITYNAIPTEEDYTFALSGPGNGTVAGKVNGKDYRINLAGDFNLANATTAVIIATHFGASYEQTAGALANVIVPGRMEIIRSGAKKVYVDYAHNYDSLYKLLSSARTDILFDDDRDPNVIVVLGSTGNKGENRRADFAKVLSQLADIAILTTDDPGFEDPMAIAEQIASGINDSVDVEIVIDREEAIRHAIENAKPHDIVVLAGKGRDKFQKINGEDVPYDGDYEIAEKVLHI
ncbi:MAG: UDP-N-acetylmuramyl-tripeptide synthetase [Lactobacillales bacterium]|jgi:UDP-N-acetylmuramoyl-L-alanyl-D-glutamate-L-lysine ligase|nr:UDP-N-acetylmuramyl-tripeptide synthetase [Lactobacillales bacterium]